MSDTDTSVDEITARLNAIRDRHAAARIALDDADDEVDAAILAARDAGFTQRTIADIFGWTGGAVSQREQKARKRARRDT